MKPNKNHNYTFFKISTVVIKRKQLATKLVLKLMVKVGETLGFSAMYDKESCKA